MKWWKSFILALGVFTSVVAVSLFSLVGLNVVSLDAASVPVYPSSNSSVVAVSQDFELSKKSLADNGIVLSVEPRVVLGYASWITPAQQDKDVIAAASVLAEEWVKYDLTFIQNTGIKKIYLVRNLSVNGQARSGMPEPVLEDALYFDVANNYLTSENGQYMRRTFHHEFRHLIDYNLYGTYSPANSLWQKCNAPSFKYGSGGAAMYNDPEYAHKSHPVSGFVNGYATSGIDEDRAEVYALFMTNPEKLQSMAIDDSSLACKVTLVQSTQSLLL